MFKEEWNEIKGLNYIGLYFLYADTYHAKVLTQNGDEVYCAVAITLGDKKGLVGLSLTVEQLEEFQPVSSEVAENDFSTAKKEVDFMLQIILVFSYLFLLFLSS